MNYFDKLVRPDIVKAGMTIVVFGFEPWQTIAFWLLLVNNIYLIIENHIFLKKLFRGDSDVDPKMKALWDNADGLISENYAYCSTQILTAAIFGYNILLRIAPLPIGAILLLLCFMSSLFNREVPESDIVS